MLFGKDKIENYDRLLDLSTALVGGTKRTLEFILLCNDHLDMSLKASILQVALLSDQIGSAHVLVDWKVSKRRLISLGALEAPLTWRL